ncbi:MAG: amino acid permease [Actinomycetota bacterium]|nr:amino acid permease [Actinomycetota bacterium]
MTLEQISGVSTAEAEPELRAPDFAAQPQTPPIRVEVPESSRYRLKKRLLGAPLHTEELENERLGRPTALAVFASDCLSSSAYATEEILRVLIPVVSVAAFALVVPITVALLVVLGFLILSYRQTIKEYPSAGGAYIVTKDNFGKIPALVAGVSLLTDYILTVAVSVAAGSAALASAVPALQPWVVPLSVAFIAMIAFGNLRGVKESGKVFAVPTYFFLGNMMLLLAWGAFQLVGGHLPQQSLHRPGLLDVSHAHPANGIFMGAALFVVLKAFASGGAAVTGVEAISNGVPAFKVPAWKNARSTLVWMGSLLGVMFLGLSILAAKTHAAPFIKETPTVISQVGKLVYGGGPAGHLLFYMLQIGTLLILVLAANTSFADFPRLASFAATDGFMPRQLTKRGHRLVFSNGIVSLATAATVLVIATNAKVSRLIPLYAIGVFTSFTLSQAGMAKHHWTRREPGWRSGLFVNGMGALLSLIVDLIIATTKFSEGGWVIIVTIPILVLVLLKLNHQYVEEAAELRQDAPLAAAAPILRRHAVLILVNELDLAAAQAIRYARSLTPDDLRAIHFAVDTTRAAELRHDWGDLGLSRIPLDIIECPDRRLTRAAVDVVAEALGDGETEVTVLLPRLEYDRRWHRLLHDGTARAIASALSDVPHASVTLIPYHLRGNRPNRGEPMAKPAAKPSRKSDRERPIMPSSMVIPCDTVAIGGLHHRDRVTVSGRVRQVRIQPRAGVATLEVTLADGTGDIRIIFLGRRHVAGIGPGTYLSAKGIVGEHAGHLEMLNPHYELLVEA